MKSLRSLLIKICTNRFLHFNQSSAVRGFIATFFKDELLANRNNDKLRYQSSLVQYKIIQGKIFLTAMEQGIDLLREVNNLKFLRINGEKIYIEDISYLEGEQYIGEVESDINYKFLTPWIPLNQENYQRYISANEEDQKLEILKKILVGNIISFCKSFDYHINNKICVHKLAVIPGISKVKNNKMTSFTGEFSINFLLPQYWGIGRSSSKGYGTVIQL